MKKILLITLLALFFAGCQTKYVYIQPEYPKLKAPNEVKAPKNIIVRKRCLFIEDHNTSLCNEDLKIVLTTINKYKVNLVFYLYRFLKSKVDLVYIFLSTCHQYPYP